MSSKVQVKCPSCGETLLLGFDLGVTPMAGYATDRQKNYIKGLCKQRSIPTPDGIDYLTIGEASALIATLKRNTE